MWEVRVPVRTVEAFLFRFAAEGLGALDRPDRRPTRREAAVERLLALLEDPPADHAPEWDSCTVPYIGRCYSAREVASLRTLMREGRVSSRACLARELCRLARLYDARGRPRIANAQDVLKRMAMDNVLELPRPAPQRPRASSPETPKVEGVGMAAPVDEVGALQLVQVAAPETSRLWRELLRRYHYIPEPRLFGAQLRYLVLGDRGEDDVVAVVGFAAAAWRILPRDAWIGWNEEQRTRNLRFVVNNARFLILPWVQCRNLASRILGAVARRLPGDWETRYGYRPVLLETFVQLDRFVGTCYRAANWVLAGRTAGYSVHGTAARRSAPARAIFLYPLQRDFRRVLCGPKC